MFGIPFLLVGQSTMSVWTDIQKRSQLTLEIPDQNRGLKQFAGYEISRSGKIVSGCDRVPGCLEEMALLRAMLRFGIILVRPQQVPKLALVDEHGNLAHQAVKNHRVVWSFRLSSGIILRPFRL